MLVCGPLTDVGHDPYLSLLSLQVCFIISQRLRNVWGDYSLLTDEWTVNTVRDYVPANDYN